MRLNLGPGLFTGEVVAKVDCFDCGEVEKCAGELMASNVFGSLDKALAVGTGSETENVFWREFLDFSA